MKRNSILFVFTLLQISQYECLEDIHKVSLKNATVLESTSTVPSTISRKINTSRQNNIDNSSLNKHSARRLGKHSDFVWKWDEWCQYQPHVGSCDENITRYYYNTAMEKCLTFQYSGCNANKNNFETDLDCERYCKVFCVVSCGSPPVVAAGCFCIFSNDVDDYGRWSHLPSGSGYILDDDFARPSFCSYQPDSGMCVAFLKKYYYDINDNICKKFIYGGCGGNYNRFDTILSCMDACHTK